MVRRNGTDNARHQPRRLRECSAVGRRDKSSASSTMYPYRRARSKNRHAFRPSDDGLVPAAALAPASWVKQTKRWKRSHGSPIASSRLLSRRGSDGVGHPTQSGGEAGGVSAARDRVQP